MRYSYMNLMFKDLKVGDRFFVNGNHYTKQSSRTAMMNQIFETDKPTGQWFYFGGKEIVKLL